MKRDKSIVQKPLWQKLFARFALFAVLVLGLLWILQTVFFQTFYDGMMIRRTKRAAASLAEDCTPQAVDALAREQSLFLSPVPSRAVGVRNRLPHLCSYVQPFWCRSCYFSDNSLLSLCSQLIERDLQG